jgi:hypothetical protein
MSKPQQARVVLGEPEMNLLKAGHSLVVNLKPGTNALVIVPSVLLKRREEPPIGSIESIFAAMKK